MAYGQSEAVPHSESAPPNATAKSHGGIFLTPQVTADIAPGASLLQRPSSDSYPSLLQKAASEKSQLPQPGHYTIQVGAFRRQEGAGKLLDELRQKGYHPYLLQGSLRNGERVFRIWVGEFGSLAEASALQSRLQRDAFDTYVRRAD